MLRIYIAKPLEGIFNTSLSTVVPVDFKIENILPENKKITVLPVQLFSFFSFISVFSIN